MSDHFAPGWCICYCDFNGSFPNFERQLQPLTGLPANIHAVAACVVQARKEELKAARVEFPLRVDGSHHGGDDP